jgi:hypothetical protein
MVDNIKTLFLLDACVVYIPTPERWNEENTEPSVVDEVPDSQHSKGKHIN